MSNKKSILFLAIAAGVAAFAWVTQSGRDTVTYSSEGKQKLEALKKDIVKYGGYVWDCGKSQPKPPGRKTTPYQTLDELSGDRDMEKRYVVMDMPESFEGKTVLDLGCNLGRICIDAAKRGATRVVGVDFAPDLIDVAKRYADWRHDELGEPTDTIEYYVYDLNQGVDKLKELIGEEQFDYVFCLSVWGVVEHQKIWDVLNQYTGELCWFEGHNINGKYGDQTRQYIERELTANLNTDKIQFLGYTNDDKRRQRANFKMQWKSS